MVLLLSIIPNNFFSFLFLLFSLYKSLRRTLLCFLFIDSFFSLLLINWFMFKLLSSLHMESSHVEALTIVCEWGLKLIIEFALFIFNLFVCINSSINLLIFGIFFLLKILISSSSFFFALKIVVNSFLNIFIFFLSSFNLILLSLFSSWILLFILLLSSVFISLSLLFFSSSICLTLNFSFESSINLIK